MIIIALVLIAASTILCIIYINRDERCFYNTSNIHVTQIENVINGSFVNMTDMINLCELPQLLSELKLKATLTNISPYYTSDELWVISGRTNGKLFNIILGKDNIVYHSGNDVIKYRIKNPDELIKWLNSEVD